MYGWMSEENEMKSINDSSAKQWVFTYCELEMTRRRR
jgi:hypothetical protein